MIIKKRTQCKSIVRDKNVKKHKKGVCGSQVTQPRVCDKTGNCNKFFFFGKPEQEKR